MSYFGETGNLFLGEVMECLAEASSNEEKYYVSGISVLVTRLCSKMSGFLAFLLAL